MHTRIEALLVHRHALLPADQLRQVERKSVRVEQRESLLAVNLGLPGSLGLVNHALQQLDAILQRAQERTFLLLHHLHNQHLLSRQFGEGIAHLGHECGHEPIDESLLLAQERISVAHGTAQDAANHIPGLGITRQLSVGNGKGNGSQMVHNHTQSNVLLLVLTILASGHISHNLDKGLEYVRVVVGCLSLQRAHQTFKTHARVYHLGGQPLQTAVSLSVVLHKHEVPDFNDLWIILVHKFASWHLSFFLCRTGVHMEFGARSARPCVAHLPEVVMLIAVDDVVFRQELLPDACSLVVASQSFLGTTLEHRGIEVIRVYLQHIHNVFPRP